MCLGQFRKGVQSEEIRSSSTEIPSESGADERGETCGEYFRRSSLERWEGNHGEYGVRRRECLRNNKHFKTTFSSVGCLSQGNMLQIPRETCACVYSACFSSFFLSPILPLGFLCSFNQFVLFSLWWWRTAGTNIDWELAIRRWRDGECNESLSSRNKHIYWNIEMGKEVIKSYHSGKNML